MIVSIHQPEYLPWLGFFDKMNKCDLFVLLDNVQYRKNYFQNRNRIRTKDGWCWLTVPVITKGKTNQLIKAVSIDNKEKWQEKTWKSIYYTYKNAPYWKEYSPFFEEIYHKKWDKLSKLNEEMIKYLTKTLGIKTKIVIASELGIEGKSTDLLLGICKKLKADSYLSGRFGKEYLDENKFNEAKIKINYHEFNHPKYSQLFEPFIPEMSTIDLLFCHGPKSLTILSGGK